MKIEDIRKSDIETIANLHQKNLVSPSSKIGQAYLKKLYNLLLSKPEIHTCLLAREKGEIIGSITATLDFQKTNKTLKKLISLPIIFHILEALILRRVTLSELIERFRFEQYLQKNAPKPYPDILTLFVVANQQRKGVGKFLVNAILKNFKKRGIKKVYVDTLKTNTRAVLFYQSLGFILKETVADSVVFERTI